MESDSSFGRRRFLRGAAIVGALGAATHLGTESAFAAPGDDGVFSVRDFGASGNGTTDDAPAIRAALDAAGSAGGGIVLFPAGRYLVASAVSKDFSNLASTVILQGRGSSSQVLIKAGAGTVALNLTNVEQVLVENLVFVGTPGVTTDAKVALRFGACIYAEIRRCDFYGVSSKAADGAVVQAVATDLRITQTAFRGCGGNSGIGTPVVGNVNWRALTVTDTDFVDYGYLNGVFHSKTPIAAPESWIRLGNAMSPHTLFGGQVSIQRVFMDEGALFGVACLPNAAVSPKIENVVISGMRMNGAGFDGASAVIAQWIKNLRVEHCRFGYTTNVRTAIRLRQIDSALIDSCQCELGMNQITADNEVRTLTVRESIYKDLLSEAADTQVIKNGTAATLMKAAGTIAANSLVVAAPNATKRVVTAPAGAQASAVLGVALDTVAAGVATRVVRLQGSEVTVRSDGVSAIQAGQAMTPSPSMAGRVRPLASGMIVGRALEAGPASTSVSVRMLLGAAVLDGVEAEAAVLQNGWQNHSTAYSEAGYYRDTAGIVHLVGMIKGGAVAEGTILFTLPLAFRPARAKLFPVVSRTGPASILVRSDGVVAIRSGFSPDFTSLEGAAFRAGASGPVAV